MRRNKKTAIVFLLFAAALLCLGADIEFRMVEKCPVCKKLMDPDWFYCPYDGIRLAKKDVSEIQERSPEKVLATFYTAYGNRNKKLLEECIDLEYMLEEMLTKGISNIEGLTPAMRAELRAKLIPIASRNLAPAILDIMVSDAVQREFPFRGAGDEALTLKTLKAFYKMQQKDNITRFIPLRGIGPVNEQIVLRKSRGRWFIIEMPGF